MTRGRFLAVLCLALPLPTGASTAQDLVDRDRPFEPPPGTAVERHVPVAMRDGVRLDTMVVLPPEHNAKLPVILVRTPYDREADELATFNVFYEHLLKSGYALVVQNERGRYFSEGRYTILGRAAEDGYDTLSWIAAQPWSNGKVGTFGCSSSGENQLALAAANHPAHRAMIPLASGAGVARAGPVREQGSFYRGGVWQQGWFEYFYNDGHANWPRPPAGLSNEDWTRFAPFYTVSTQHARRAPQYFNQVRKHLPMTGMMRAANGPATDFESYLNRKPGNPAWERGRVTDNSKIFVPGLWGEGLYDLSARAAIAFFKVTREYNLARGHNNQFILINNFTHCGFGRERRRTRVGERRIGDARYGYAKLFRQWFDHWLKGVKNGVTERPPILAYMTGTNEWRSFPSFVTNSHRALTLYLTSRGKAERQKGDGELRLTPAKKPQHDSFTYDPARPVISMGGDSFGVGEGHVAGSFDQALIEARPDVLVYTSETLQRDVPVFGFIQTVLYVASNRPDTDFTVKLVDVMPNGRSFNITDTILRMRHRKGLDRQIFMKPGKTYKIEMPLMFAANVFERGHRIRLEISSSNFPNYARSLNTKADPYASTEFAIARNHVRHGGRYASRMILPVLPDLQKAE